MAGYAIRDASRALVADEAIESLLRAVYVGEGYTDPGRADAIFPAADVRSRGRLIVALGGDGALAGMVIAVPPGSPFRVAAREGEAEMHLLAVAPGARGAGLGARLVDACLDAAREAGAGRMVLWTQPSMESAQRLYRRAGFRRAPERDGEVSAPGRTFLVFVRELSGRPPEPETA